MSGAAYVPPKKAETRAVAAPSAPPPLEAAQIAGAHRSLEGLTEEERTPRSRGFARQTGVSRPLSEATHEQLDWRPLSDGRRDGRLSLEWPGAGRLRLHVRDFDAQGGELWIRNADGSVAGGPYTGQGPFGDGDFWTEAATGDRLVVEWTGPDGAQPRFFLDRIVQQWISLDVQPGSCRQDVTCSPEYANEARAVASIQFVGDDGGSFLCSGFLINTRRSSFSPLFMTASHCITSEAEARSAITYWGFQTAKCNGEKPGLDKAAQVSGAQLLSVGMPSAGDFSLLRLSKVPENAYFLGWSAADPAVKSKVVSIHHPGRQPDNYKRITFSDLWYDSPEVIYIGGLMWPAAYFHQVEERLGRTEAGASGAPLLNESKQAVGIMSYGRVYEGLDVCQHEGRSGHGKFSLIYPQIRGFLEEIQPPSVNVSRRQISFRVVDGVVQAPDRQQITVTTESTRPVQFRVTSAAPWVSALQTIGEASAGAPAVIELLALPGGALKPGGYKTTVTVTPNSSPEWVAAPKPVVFDAELNVSASKPLVTLAVEPNPVVETPMTLQGYNFRFQIRIEEKAGLPVRITSLRMDGVDLSLQLVKMLGTGELPAEGVIVRTFEGRLQPSSAERLIEIGGWTPGTGALWTAAARVRFLPLP